MFLLFVLALELLIFAVHQTTRSQEIKFGPGESKLLLYTDDILFAEQISPLNLSTQSFNRSLWQHPWI